MTEDLLLMTGFMEVTIPLVQKSELMKLNTEEEIQLKKTWNLPKVKSLPVSLIYYVLQN